MNDLFYSEVWNGKEMEMSSPGWNHNRVSGNIYRYLYDQFDGDYIITQEPNLHISDKLRFIPDIVICRSEIIQNNGIYEAPELIIEILSTSTGNVDKRFKFDSYFDFGVKEYWLVEPLGRFVDVYVDRKLWNSFHYATDDVYKILSSAQKERIVTKMESFTFGSIELELKNIFKGVR